MEISDNQKDNMCKYSHILEVKKKVVATYTMSEVL